MFRRKRNYKGVIAPDIQQRLKLSVSLKIDDIIIPGFKGLEDDTAIYLK